VGLGEKGGQGKAEQGGEQGGAVKSKGGGRGEREWEGGRRRGGAVHGKDEAYSRLWSVGGIAPMGRMQPQLCTALEPGRAQHCLLSHRRHTRAGGGEMGLGAHIQKSNVRADGPRSPLKSHGSEEPSTRNAMIWT
jgi:hypothetical protein